MKVLAAVATLISVTQAVTANWAVCLSDDCNTGYKCCESTPPNGGTTTMVCVDLALSNKVVPSGTYATFTNTCSAPSSNTGTTTLTDTKNANSLMASSALALAVVSSAIVA